MAPLGMLLLEAVSFRVLALLLRAGNDLPLDSTRRSEPWVGLGLGLGLGLALGLV